MTECSGERIQCWAPVQLVGSVITIRANPTHFREKLR